MMARRSERIDSKDDTYDRLFKYGLVAFRDRRLLLCRPYAFPDLIMPGGLREAGESHMVTLLREIREELGPDAVLDESSLRWFGHFEDLAAGLANTVIEMDVYRGELRGELVASAEIAELVWFGRSDDPALLSPVVRNKIWPAILTKEWV